MLRCLILLILLAYHFSSYGQVSSLRCKVVYFPTTNISLDTLSIAADKIKLLDIKGGTDLSRLRFSYDINKNLFSLYSTLTDSTGEKKDSTTTGEVTVCYRVYPFNFSKEQANLSQAQYDSGRYSQAYYAQLEERFRNYTQQREEIFPTSEIKKNGSLTRGVSFGNTQDVFVNSALNLQLDGKLTDDIHLTAAISDQNVPYQPEGNTQNIHQFDVFFINLRKKKGFFAAGYVIIKNDSTYFLKYYKNIQGAQAEVRLGDTTKKISSTTKAGIAIAKGQFSSQIVQVSEGVQGPYRLSVENNQFIVILANSERVFLDGRKLERGFNYDYIIDYNTGEITFNTNIVITKFSRVRVDFEYSSQYFSRTIAQASHYQKIKKTDFAFNIYSESDNQNSPLIQTLTNADRITLAAAGDNTSLMFSETADTVAAFQTNRILYTQKDTTVGGITYTIFVRATAADTRFFSVTFSEVSAGVGDYVQGSTTSNGREFKWVAPINGVPQGKFAPLRALVPPNKKQMTTLAVAHQVTKHEKVFVETAISETDRNVFSTKDDADNNGYATKTGIQSVGRPLAGAYMLDTYFDYEYNSQTFNPIDRFRYIEFDRDWSADTIKNIIDNITNAGLKVVKESKNILQYRFTHRNRGAALNGYQHNASLSERIGKFALKSNAFLMNSNRPTTQSEWYRYNIDIALKGNKFTPGYIFATDRNKIRIANSDSVIATAMNYQEQTVYIEQGDSLKATYRIDHTQREDFLPIEGKMRLNNTSQTTNFSLQRKNEKSEVRVVFTYRELINVNLPDQPKEETVMGRLDWNKQFLNNHVKSELSFNTSSGRELRRDYVFLQVDAGQGTHTWRDDNGDGLQQLNEFYLAINADERNYVKFFTPTNNYIQAFTTLFNYRLNIDAPSSWASYSGFKGFVGKFSNTASVVTNRRTTDSRALQRVFPFAEGIDEINLLSDKTTIRNTVFFNRKSPKYGGEIRTLLQQNKQLLSNGFEQRNQAENVLNIRWNSNKSWSHKIEITQRTTTNRSDFLLNRNYTILDIIAEPSIAWQPNNNLRLTLTYTVKDKRNIFIPEGETALLQDGGVLLRWTKVGTRTLEANFKNIYIQYNGVENSPVGYEMLEALNKGVNYTWGVTWTQRLANGLQINFSYTGRKADGQEAVHIGRMQVTALF